MSEKEGISRYHQDFIEIEKLGTGGFGTVFKARNRLDDKEYAVKKILFRGIKGQDFRLILREVKALASLSHTHIVGYHATWMEDDSEPPDEEDSYGGSSFSTSESKERGSRSGEPLESQTCQILYIQMELCSLTLRRWLDDRNETLGAAGALVLQKPAIMKIFNQILQGVNYIHQKKMIHRDLKPENIFLHGDEQHVKIGDFGLAREDLIHGELHGSNPQTGVGGSGGSYLGGLGTVPYAAPEMMRGESGSNKSDIYSMGIVFLEMCVSITTRSELFGLVGDLRKGQLPKQLRTKAWKGQTKAMQKMTHRDAAVRPSAKDLLGQLGPLSLTAEQKIQELQEKLENKNKQMQRLKKKLRDSNKRLKITSDQLSRLKKRERHSSGEQVQFTGARGVNQSRQVGTRQEEEDDLCWLITFFDRMQILYS